MKAGMESQMVTRWPTEAELLERLGVVTDHNARLRAILLDYLSAAWNGVPLGFPATRACIELDHPIVRRDGHCGCGRVKR